MERIKLALERARETRKSAPSPLEHLEVATRNETLPEDIEYTRTRRFDPDPDVLKRNRVILDNTDAVAFSAFNVLRTQVLQRMGANGWTAIAVTSPGQDEGKSLVAVNLAISIARQKNRTVLLVDLDLRRPGVHKYFGWEPEKGISDHLLHDVPVSEIMFNPGVESLVVLPGRESLPHSSEALSSPKMMRLVEDLKGRYPNRLVLFDLPPLLSADDALAFSPFVDAVLLVLQDGRTPREQIMQSIGYLDSTRLLGTVLNRSKEAMTPLY